MKTSTRRTLEVVRRILVKDGWVQDKEHCDDGYCVTGACVRAAGGRNCFYHAVVNVLGSHLPDEYLAEWVLAASALVAFNDEPDRVESDVFALIDKALEER